MKINKKVSILFFVLLGIIFTNSFCSRFKQEGGTTQPDIKNEQAEGTVTPIPSITPIPTNLIEIEDPSSPIQPRIIDFHPYGGEEIGENGSIEVVFDQAMDQNSTSKAWTVSHISEGQIDGKLTWPDATTLEFIPNQAFTPGNIYQVRISTEAKSVHDKYLVEPFVFDVRIAGELMVSQVFPENGTQDVESNSIITVIFNRPVVPIKISEEKQNLPDPISTNPIIEGSGEWLNSSVYIFHPNEPLMSLTTYQIEVIEGLQDTLGSTLNQTYSWEFVTAAPTIASFGISEPIDVMNPKDNYEDVRPDSSFYINFQQPMDEESVVNAISIFTQEGEDFRFNHEWTSEFQIIITPTLKLDLDTSYTLMLTENARSATGGKLFEGMKWDFSTVPMPGIESTDPKDGSTQSFYSTRVSIFFESPIDLETIEDHIIIEPALSEDSSWYYNAWGWNVDLFGLKPSTDYSVTVLPGISDIYGNELKESYTFSFRTADLNPSAYLDLPYGPSIYTQGEEMRFYLSYVNVSTVESYLYRLPMEYFIGFENGTYNRWDFSFPTEWQVNYWSWENENDINEITRRGVYLTDLGGDSLEAGFYLLSIDSPQIKKSGMYVDTRLLIIAEANLTFKTTPTEGLVWLTDLKTGEPIESATVEIYDESLEMIGTGATNSQGLFYIDLPLEEEIYRSRYIKTGGGAPFAFAISNWGSGVSPYDFGIWSNYYSLPNQPTAYVYTDRPIYRTGQTVKFKGILRQNDDLNYRLLPWDILKVEISSFNNIVYEEFLTLSEFGTFDGELELDDNSALGYYSISVYNPLGEESIGGVGFTVAEYRKPEFQLTTEVNPEDVLAGDEFQIEIKAEYYSGGGVEDAAVAWGIQAVDYYFQPTGDLNRYNFSDYDMDVGSYYEMTGQASRKIIAEGESKTDSEGNLVLQFMGDLGESQKSRKLIFEETITDVAETSVSDRVELVVHKAKYYPGIRSQKYVGLVGEEQAFDLVVVDWDGKAIPQAIVDVEIVERRWYSVQEQDSQGFTQWQTSVEEIPVKYSKGLTVDEDGKGSIAFTPDKGGIYKAYVTIKDEWNNKAEAAAFIWISSSDYVAWRQSDDRTLTLVADQENYQPGDIAEILIASQFPGDNFALVSLERGHIQQYDVIRLESNSAVYRLPITSEMAPNVYLSVIIIQGAEDGKPDFRMGLLELKVTPDEQEVKVDISTNSKDSSPGEEVTYQIQTTDHSGKPVKAEVSLALVDLSVLSLLEPNSRPILDYFYSAQSLGVRTTIPIVYNIEHYISTYEDRLTAGEGMGSGGGKGSDVYGVFDIRGDFKDTAFWEAHLITDETGMAKVSVTLPDNLTIWRMEVRAITMDSKVGENQLDLRSTKPLLVRPQTPRFFVSGDQSVIGAAVHNNTDEDLTVNVSLVASGLDLNSPQLQEVSIGSGKQILVTWDVEIQEQAERVDLVFTAKSGIYADSSRPTLGTLDNQGIPVYRYEVPETTGTSGLLSGGGSKLEGIYLPEEFVASQGNVKINISPSLVAGMVEGLNFLKHYPYECIEQTISKFLPNVITKQVLDRAGIPNPKYNEDLKEQVNLATQRLYNWQRSNGGWGWWAEATESDPLTSAYVVLGLIEANNAGYQVNIETLERGISYLKGILMSPGSFEDQYLLNRQAFILYVLARSGNPQISLSNVMVDHRQSLSIYAKAYLAEALWNIDPEDPRLKTFVSDFINTGINSATGIHWNETWHDFWNWNSDTRTTAIVLAAMLNIDPDNPINSSIVRWLMSNRTNGRWATTQETSWTLISLARWLEITDELSANYDWAVGINGERLGDGSVNRDSLTETREFEKEINSLLSDEVNRLIIARDDGPGNLYYSAYLNVFLPVDQIQSLDRGISVSREYYNQGSIEDGRPVTFADQGDLLLSRLTIVVPNDLHYVVIDDPLPAGLEAIDPSLEISPDITAPTRYDFEGIWKQGWGWWFFDHVEFRDERVVISADYLPAGTYVYTYIVRASTPGKYFTIPPTAQEFYFPEVYGRGSGIEFEVFP